MPVQFCCNHAERLAFDPVYRTKYSVHLLEMEDLMYQYRVKLKETTSAPPEGCSEPHYLSPGYVVYLLELGVLQQPMHQYAAKPQDFATTPPECSPGPYFPSPSSSSDSETEQNHKLGSTSAETPRIGLSSGNKPVEQGQKGIAANNGGVKDKTSHQAQKKETGNDNRPRNEQAKQNKAGRKAANAPYTKDRKTGFPRPRMAPAQVPSMMHEQAVRTLNGKTRDLFRNLGLSTSAPAATYMQPVNIDHAATYTSALFGC